MDKNPSWTITNGNHRTRGWVETPEGNWVPSLHDRRRMVTTGLGMIAEKQGGTVHGPTVFTVVRLNSTSPADSEALAEMVIAQLTSK